MATYLGENVDFITEFIRLLRTSGIPISMSENIDAINAVREIGLSEKTSLKEALKVTLVKDSLYFKAFDLAFDLYFSQRELAEEKSSSIIESKLGAYGSSSQQEDLSELIVSALLDGDDDLLKHLAMVSIAKFGGMQSGKPVGGVYYLYRTVRNLDFDKLFNMLMAKTEASDGLSKYLAISEMKDLLEKFKGVLQDQIRKLLVDDRGLEPVFEAVKKPLPEDVDIMHATREELELLSKIIAPLSKKLASKLRGRHANKRKGQLDWKKTARASLASGGVPLELRFKKPKINKPEIFVLADISGSVASFARFTLHFLYALSSQFSKVRSYVFVDGVDEVTRFFEEEDDVLKALLRVSTESKAVFFDGHSDYGRVFKVFKEKYSDELTNKSSLLILGDARSNYHAPNADIFKEITSKAKHSFWLNPEPKNYWNSGDSIISQYSAFIDEVVECRSLRQLEAFIAGL